MNAIQSKQDDIKRKTLIIKELQNGLAGGNEAGLNILKNNMKLEIENLERDSKNSYESTKKLDSEIKILNFQIKKLVEERTKQNIEQKINEFKAQIINKQNEFRQLTNDLNIDLSAEQNKSIQIRNQIINSFNNCYM